LGGRLGGGRGALRATCRCRFRLRRGRGGGLLGSGSAFLLEHDEHRAHRRLLVLAHVDLAHHAGGGRRDLDHRLIGLEFDEWLILGNGVADSHQDADDRALLYALAYVRESHFGSHERFLSVCQST
jgi:hypothetical protein